MRKTCLDEIYKLAIADERVVFIGSDIASGTLDAFKKKFPERFFMEGVSEAYIVGMMAGLALSGKIPYFNTIATFLTRRCFEQTLLDAALHRLKVRLIGSGGGVVYAPLGPTHLATEDIAILRAVPGMAIVAPSDAEEMKRLMPQTLDWEGPMYIRLAKGGDPVISRSDLPFAIGKAIRMREGSDALVVSTGVTTRLALEAAERLSAKGIRTGVLHCHTIKPFDREALIAAARGTRIVVSVEEHSVIGGLGSCAAETLAEAGMAAAPRLVRLGFPDTFPDRYGSQEFLMGRYGITVEGIERAVRS